MSRQKVAVMAIVFTVGVVVGAWAAKKGIDSGLYVGRDKKEAASALLDVARKQAGEGSWERIGVARVLYLSGRKAEAQATFDELAGKKKPDAGDLIRIGRVYYQAGEWEKAKPMFERALKMESKDAPWLAEVGAYYNLHGDRAKAEEYFARSFAVEQDVWNTADAAGSYVGVTPVR